MASSGVVAGQVTVAEGNMFSASAPIGSSIGAVDNSNQGRLKIVTTAAQVIPFGLVTKARLIYVRSKDLSGVDKQVILAFNNNTTASPITFTVSPISEWLYVCTPAASANIIQGTVVAPDGAGTNVDFIVAGT